MSHKRGLQHGSHLPAKPAPGAQPVGKVFVPTPRVIETAKREEVPSRIVSEEQHNAYLNSTRRGLVNATGQPIRGLQQQTLDARKEANEAETEKCPRCDRMMKASEMKTIISNAENSSNPLRLCTRAHADGRVSCSQQAWKDPHQEQDRWKPSVPSVRFAHENQEQKAGRPYDAHRAGVGVDDLINRDTYYTESEALNAGIDVEAGVERRR